MLHTFTLIVIFQQMRRSPESEFKNRSNKKLLLVKHHSTYKLSRVYPLYLRQNATPNGNYLLQLQNVLETRNTLDDWMTFIITIKLSELSKKRLKELLVLERYFIFLIYY